MSADLVAQGLELFAGGDIAGAARVWLTAKRAGSVDAQVELYLQHLAGVAPEVLAAVSAELGEAPSVEASPPPLEPAPAVVSVPAPTPAPAPAPAPAPRVAAAPRSFPGLATAPPSPPPPPPPPPAAVLAEPIPVPLAPPNDGGLLPIPLPAVEAPVLEPAAAPAVATAPVVEPVAPPPIVPAADLDLSLFAEPIATAEPSSLAPAPPPVAPPAEVAGADPWVGADSGGPPIVAAGGGGGLALVVTPAPPPPLDLPQTEVAEGEAKLKELLELDDFSGALEVAERLLAAEPAHELALVARRRCREALQRMYESKIGALGAVPRVLIPPEQVIWLDLDHRSGFILAQVDGRLSFEELIELTGMERLEALRILASLVRNKVIGA